MLELRILVVYVVLLFAHKVHLRIFIIVIKWNKFKKSLKNSDV
jgi:hypothetical protein